jgi:hypothetical protein
MQKPSAKAAVRSRAAVYAALIIAVAATFSCSGKMARVTRVTRQDLFSLSLGRMEDQIDLTGDQVTGSSKLRLFMRDGIFFVSNGKGRKMMEFSSYGDLLSLIYDPESNPAPVLLSTQGEDSSFRKAYQHPFQDIGEIAVNSKQDIFIEDKLPPERGVPDETSQSILDAVVLRFDKQGTYKDFIGREGIGGTPFPNIIGLYCTNSDEIVVVSVSQEDWRVNWYDSQGGLVYSLSIRRDSLPFLEKKEFISSLEKIVPAPDARILYMKIDYYNEDIDPTTKASTGVRYHSSLVWHIDPRDGSVYDPIAVPSVNKKEEGKFGSSDYTRVYEFIGVASGKNLIFMMPDDKDAYSVMILNGQTKGIQKISISLEGEDLLGSAFHVSSDGILSAILVSSFDAKVALWRIDRILGEVRR